MYYLLLVLATVLYTVSFYCNQQVERRCRSGMDAAILFSTVAWSGFLAVLLILLKGRLAITPFSALCASLHAFFMVTYSFLSLKALSVADLGKYSMYAMLGGMLVPFATGILFFEEGLTAGKIICCVILTLALYLDSKSGKITEKSLIYLVAVFFVNGSFGVLSTVHQSGGFATVNSNQYIALQAILVVAFGVCFLGVRRLRRGRLHIVETKKAFFPMVLYGLLNGSAELLLLLALRSGVQASVQYPIITGGVVIGSALLSLLTGETRGWKRLLPAGITLVGLLFLI